MFENKVPVRIKNSLGASMIIWLTEKNTQMVVIRHKYPNGISGRTASQNGLILPVLFLYDKYMFRPVTHQLVTGPDE